MSDSLSAGDQTESNEEIPEGLDEDSTQGLGGYPLDELAIRDERRTAVDIVRRMDQGRFVLDADFQRDFVWSIEKQSRLIESILMRIPLPVFYIAENSEGKLVAVDGRQRLTTLHRFVHGDLELDLPDREELHGKSFSDLSLRLQARVEDCQLLFHIIDHSVPERALLDIFERVNGGEVLTRQQMRNAIYNGPATRLLQELAREPLFAEVTGGSLKAKKHCDSMRDREFVNRFCSFAVLPLEEYSGDMDEWLAKGLRVVNQMNDAERSELRERFLRGLTNNKTVFGKHAFRKHQSGKQARSPLNISLFEVMMWELSKYQENLVESKSSELQQVFYGLMNNDEFVRSLTDGTSKGPVVRKRFQFGERMGRVLDA